MPLAPPPPSIDFRLRYKLRRVAGYLRALRFHRQGAAVWGSVAFVAALLLLVQRHVPTLAAYAAPALLPVFAVAAGLAAWFAWRARSSLTQAALHIERRHPELHSALRAAAEQLPDARGQFHFLQRRVIDAALRHADTHDWARPPRRDARRSLALHAVAMVAALGLSLEVVRAHHPGAAGRPALSSGLDITPGDLEVERGSSVVIAARFGGAVPAQTTLVWQTADGAPRRATMHQSLADPVFAFTLPRVTADTVYHIEHDSAQTRSFTLTVFDRPALLRADATLDYPDYTNLADRHLADTRRISAVVGTKLAYAFAMNKPLARATLRAADGREVPLERDAGDSSRFRLTTIIAQSERYTLQLEDDAHRTNAAPIDIRIEAVENRRPELKLTFPRGDQRVSPLEEMQLQAEARDDFALLDYGLGVSVADAPPGYLSFATPNAPRTVEAQLAHQLALEKYHVKPDQLVTWFAWADDIGPDGKTRRTTSDVFFAEVRPLEEIFREDATGGGNQNRQGNAGGPGEELIETQRQISIATWKLRQQDAVAPEFAGDAATLHDSQQAALQQLGAVRQRLEDPNARAAADEAEPLMKKAADALGELASARSPAALDTAWSGARGAYQALLRMQSRETRVSQSRNGGQGGGNRNRGQLDQLEFRHEQDRYETETQAQPPPTPEEREQLQVLARLRELARRQQDINSRLQELQTALAAAQDEAQREQIRRELKRLEDEQRRMLSQLDEARQRVDRLQPGQQQQQARQQLDRTRDEMQRASEQLSQGEVSQALAAGTRASENLQRTSEDLRREAAGRFGEGMREARRQARELTQRQQETAHQLDAMSRGQQSLDDSAQRDALARQLQDQAERRNTLLESLRQITEESEGTEPRLHRQLYDLLRQQGQSGADQSLRSSAEMLRRGFVEPARDQQAPVLRDFEQLQRAVERAAGSVLGDETSELRFAQRELEDLTRELQRDRIASNPQASSAGEEAAPQPSTPAAPGENEERGRTGQPQVRPGGDTPLAQQNQPAPNEAASPASNGSQPGPSSPSPSPSTPGDGNASASLEQLARQFGGASRGGDPARGPLTGGGFATWAERLRTVEELMESPDVRQQLAAARARAEEFRRDNQRRGQAPRWDMVEMGIVKPLDDARGWLRQELTRREHPDALQPVDRDPVPERYAESVRKYYEALGEE
jgi:hypothetical protein